MTKPKEIQKPEVKPATPTQPQQAQTPQTKPTMDIKDAFNKLATNILSIRDHITALKMLCKGIDVSELERANTENQNIVLALANFIQNQQPPLNRAQRRKMEREALKKK